MSKSLAKILMYITGTFITTVVDFFVMVYSYYAEPSLGEISFFPSPLQNMITLIESLIENGFIGIITALILVGQFLLITFTMYLIGSARQMDRIQQKSIQNILLTILAALLIIYLFFI